MIKDVYFGKVLDNDDPDQKGGLKVQIDAIEDGKAYGGGEYIPPVFPFAGSNVGFFFLPAKGTMVEVELESDGEKGTEALSARWRGVLYNDSDKIPAEFLTDQTNRGGIKVGDGILLFDQKRDLVSLISNNVRLGEESASHPLVRGDTYNGELSTYLTAEDVAQALENTHWSALATALTTWGSLPPASPVLTDVLIAFATAVKPGATALKAGGPTWKAAIGAFKAALSSWLSTKVKTE